MGLNISNIKGVMTLTDSGSIILRNDNGIVGEVSIEEFINILQADCSYANFKELCYDAEAKNFIIKKRMYGSKKEDKLELSSIHMELLNQGKVDSYVQKLLDFATKSQHENKKRQVEKKVLETGENPTDPEEIKLYLESLNEQLSKTNATIIIKGAISWSPLVALGLFVLLYKVGINADSILRNICCLGSLVPLLYSLFVGAVVSLSYPSFSNKWSKRKRKMLLDKINSLDKEGTLKRLYDSSVELTPEGLEKKELDDVYKYSDTFMEEVAKVNQLIEQLPPEERKGYVQEVEVILNEYLEKADTVISKDGSKIELGTASHLWEIISEMLPELNKLSGRVQDRLTIIEKRQKLLADYNRMKESLKSLESEKGYIDGYTDGYTVDYGDSSVAYATIPGSEETFEYGAMAR